MNQHLLYPDWRESVTYDANGPQPAILTNTETLKVIVAGLEAGQTIPPHPEALAVYHILDGTGWMLVDDERLDVGPGATVITPAGTVRGMEAETRLAFMATRIAGEE